MPHNSIPFDWIIFGGAVKAVRTQRGLTIRAACAQCEGISPGTWTRAENGTSQLIVPVYLTLAKWADLDPFECMDICRAPERAAIADSLKKCAGA